MGWRLPLLALGALALFAGLDGGLLRLGWTAPLADAERALAHGPLMVSGFLGTVIGLERAAALRRPWGWLAPLLAGAGAIATIAAPSGAAAPWLFAAASAVFTAIAVLFAWRQRALFTAVMALGALGWLAGNALQLAGQPADAAVPFWIAFLILTIAGERLELSRLMRPTTLRRLTAPLPLLLLVVGLLAGAALPGADWPARLFGAGLVALAVWLAAYDAARRTVRQPGLTRYIAVCLLGGYVWLAAAGLLILAAGLPDAGPQYDAVLHAVFLGFVFAMIFGHAPVIVPALLGATIPWTRWFYLHLGLLHASLVLRIGGDLADLPALRAQGGLGNAAAILLFLAMTAGAALHHAHRRRET